MTIDYPILDQKFLDNRTVNFHSELNNPLYYIEFLENNIRQLVIYVKTDINPPVGIIKKDGDYWTKFTYSYLDKENIYDKPISSLVSTYLVNYAIQVDVYLLNDIIFSIEKTSEPELYNLMLTYKDMNDYKENCKITDKSINEIRGSLTAGLQAKMITLNKLSKKLLSDLEMN